jgi:hypothetical protein
MFVFPCEFCYYDGEIRAMPLAPPTGYAILRAGHYRASFPVHIKDLGWAEGYAEAAPLTPIIKNPYRTPLSFIAHLPSSCGENFNPN